MKMAQYSIWLLEYAHVPTQHISSVLAGQHNKGTRELVFSYLLLKGEGHNILVDVGTNQSDPYTQKLHERDHVFDWQSPEKVLAKVGLTPEDIDTVFITHAHYDHMDNLNAFCNAHFYLQRKELEGWLWAMSLDPKYSFINLALNPSNVVTAVEKVKEGRMTLVDGECENILPGIHLYPNYDGHSFAHQVVVIDNTINGVKERWVAAGDAAYVRENLTGIGGDGSYVPLGLAVGSPYNMMKALDDVIQLVEGNMKNIIVGHECDNWELFPAWKTEDGLHVAEIFLAADEPSRKPR